MSIRPVIAINALLSSLALSCGHSQDMTPPMATPSSESTTTTTHQRTAQLRTRSDEAPSIMEEKEREPDTVMNAGATTPPATAAPLPRAASIEDFMLEHYVITAWARDSIVDGNLEPIRAPLLALASYSYSAVTPGGWMAGLLRLQAAARLTGQAETLGAAAAGIATIARTCGQCHSEHGGPKAPHFKADDASEASDHLNGRMLRHAWAAERLWEGLATPSDNAWQAGAAALALAPRSAPETRPALKQEALDTLNTLRQLGAEAGNADSVAERVAVYGRLLFICSRCHRHDAN
jgi:hypothetical protein